MNRKDDDGNNVFSGGFLGLDNIGPFDRSAQLPPGGQLEQSDGTAWMAMYCLNLLEISLVLARHDRTYEDLATKFLEHFTFIAAAMNDQGLWDEEDGFYYDVLLVDGERVPLRVRSMVGLIPLFATTTLGAATLEALPDFHERLRWFVANKPHFAHSIDHTKSRRARGPPSVDRRARPPPADPARHARRGRVPVAVRSAGAVAAASRPAVHDRPRGMDATVDYEPGESTTALFGGNSNWRGPIWFPVNYLVIESLRRFARYLGDEAKVQCPTGEGRFSTMAEVADELSRRLVGIFLEGRDGRRPVFGGYEKLQTDPRGTA